MEPSSPGWIDWSRNEHAVVQDGASGASGEDIVVPEAEEEEEEYVGIGMHRTNPDGRICRCGSRTHLVRTSHMCPLNDRYRDDVGARLRLYVPRRMWRWYDCDDGRRRKYEGEVTSVGEGAKLVVKYDNGEEDLMHEQDLLQVFVQMKREIKSTNKRKRPASSQVGKRSRSCRL